ncbi:MAG: hypothetical protein HYV78_00250 [Candidatus Wildermuthbacteria bacterium]|nr:hypothetical protein [Candidatus Wildermuthbacteria bacterium]
MSLRCSVSLSLYGQAKGFMLAELLVTLAIISLVSAIVIPNWRSGEQTLSLDRSVHQLAQDVRGVIEIALKAKPYQCAAPGALSGYGAYFSLDTPSSFLFFADCNNNQRYDAGADFIANTFSLEKGMQISEINPGSPASVVFIPPAPKVFISPGEAAALQVAIAASGNPASARSIIINSRGVVDIE